MFLTYIILLYVFCFLVLTRGVTALFKVRRKTAFALLEYMEEEKEQGFAFALCCKKVCSHHAGDELLHD